MKEKNKIKLVNKILERMENEHIFGLCNKILIFHLKKKEYLIFLWEGIGNQFHENVLKNVHRHVLAQIKSLFINF